MKAKLKVMLEEDFDSELNAMCVAIRVLEPLSWDQRWRVVNYIIARLFGRGWMLPKPANE